METAELEEMLRAQLPTLTTEQPVAPPDRVSSVRRRHNRRRQARLVTAAVVGLLASTLGVVSVVTANRTNGYADRRLPTWALDWPDRRDGSVPQSVLDGAVTAWARTAGPAGAPVTVRRVVWLAGRHVQGTDFVIAVFEAETDMGRQLVVARAVASEVSPGPAPSSEDAQGNSPWSSFTTPALGGRQPDLALSLHLPGRPLPDRPGSSPEVLYVLTDPRARGLLWSSDPPAGAPAGHVRGGLNSDDGEFIGALGVIWAPVRISTYDAEGRQLSSSVAGIPGVPESDVPQLGRPDPIVLPPGWQFDTGVAGHGPMTGGPAPARGQTAIFVRCLGPGPVVIGVGGRDPQPVPCDGQQHQREVTGSLAIRGTFEIGASRLTTYQVVLAVRP